MMLNQIPEQSKIRLSIGGKGRETKIETCVFQHIDGMYSLIRTEDGHAVHLAAVAPLKLCDDGVYELDETDV